MPYSIEELLSACQRNDVDRVQEIVTTAPALINKFDSSEMMTPLMMAIVHSKDIAIIDTLLKAGANVRLGSKQLQTPFLYAIISGRLDVLKKLLERESTLIDEIYPENATPLIIAAASNKVDLIAFLMTQPSINLNAQDNRGNTAVHVATLMGHEAALREMLNHSHVDIHIKNKEGKTPLMLAQEANQAKIVQMLNVKPSTEKSLLEIAMGTRRAPVQEMSPLEMAMGTRRAPVQEMSPLEMAMGTRRAPAMQERSPLEMAMGMRRTPLIEELLNACQEGDADKVKNILDATSSPSELVNQLGTNGLTPLMVAITNKNVAIVDILLNKGANGQFRNYQNESAFKYAITVGDVDILKKLLAQDPTLVNETYFNNETVMHVASRFSSLECAEEILKRAPNLLNKPDTRGDTPLMSAIYNNKMDSLQFLLAQPNIEISRPNNRGKTAVHLAASENHAMLQQLLSSSTFYQENLKNISKMIILGNERQPNASTEQQITAPDRVKTVSNFTGYTKSETMNTASSYPLSVTYKGKDYQIGYNIHFPADTDKKINHVIVGVYGGNTLLDLNDHYLNSILGELHYMTSKYHCAAISLALPDLLQEDNQFMMSNELHEIIHACINHFHKTLKENPTALSDELANKDLDEAKYFLYGPSFGGRTAVRHGQLYPHTFDGYISHDGALDNLTADMPIVELDNRNYNNTMLPILHATDSVDPILILQNKDDNNVNIQHALDFYKELKTRGKAHLARLQFFENGSPLLGIGKHNKGHGIPLAEREAYFEAIFRFMQKGPSAIPEFHDWLFLQQASIAKQFHRNIDINERFLAIAQNKFNQSTTHRQALRQKKHSAQWHNIWDKEYKPLLLGLKKAKFLSENQEALNQQISHWENNNLLTDEVIERAISYHAAQYSEYLQEFFGLTINKNDMSHDPVIQAHFKSIIHQLALVNDVDLKALILESLYFANPQLLSPEAQSAIKTLEDIDSLQKDCLEKFEKQNQEIKHATRRTWQASAKASFAQKESNLLKEAKSAFKSENPAEITRCLHQAAKEGFAPVVSYILDKNTRKEKISPDAVDDQGHNALFYATKYGNAASAKYLVEHGATFDLEKLKALDDNGDISPFDSIKYHEIIKFLEKTQLSKADPTTQRDTRPR